MRLAAAAFLVALPCVAQPAAPYPPTGRMVDLGTGHRVHLYCTGEGNPTVMVVGAGYSFDWVLVQQEVAKFTRICTYDASGLAWSDRSPEQDCAARADEVHRLLVKAGEPGPYVLVGHSVGAAVARLYAKLHPEEVAGMAIVDHAFLDVAIPASTPVKRTDVDTMPVLISGPPILPSTEDISHFANLPERSRELHRWADSVSPQKATVETAENCLAQVKGSNLGDMPLAVVRTANGHPNYDKLQAELMGLSTHSTQFLAEKSFHMVEIDQPDVVVKAIRRVVGKQQTQ